MFVLLLMIKSIRKASTQPNYPNTKSMNITTVANYTDSSKQVALVQNEQKTLAVYCPETIFVNALSSRFIERTQQKSNGTLYKYKNNQSIFHLKKEPHEDTVNLLQNKYIRVMSCYFDNEEIDKKKLEELMNTKFWAKIVVVIFSADWEKNIEFVDRIREKVEIDKRVEVVKYCDSQTLLDVWLRS